MSEKDNSFEEITLDNDYEVIDNDVDNDNIDNVSDEDVETDSDYDEDYEDDEDDEDYDEDEYEEETPVKRKNPKITAIVLLVIVVLVGIFGYSKLVLREVVLNEESLSIVMEDNARLEATLIPNVIFSKDAVFSSDNEDVATVNSATGRIQAIKPGTAVITCSVGKITDTCTVTVLRKSMEITINEKQLLAGETFTVEPSVVNKRDVTFASSDESILTVSDEGFVQTLSAGVAQVSIYTDDYEGICTVNVMDGTKGIDVSKWNGTVNFNTIKSEGYDFVIIRAGFGQDVANKDPMFETYYSQAKSAGLKVGAYIYSYAQNEEDAKKEAQTMMTWIEGKTFEYPIIFDVEDDDYQEHIHESVKTNMIIAFCDTLLDNNYYPMIYASRAWFETEFETERLSDYDKWLAQYSHSPSYEGDYTMWQLSKQGKIGNLSADFDINHSYVDYETIIKDGGYNGF